MFIENVDHLFAIFNVLMPFLLLSSFELTNWKAESANEGLRPDHVDVVKGIASQTWAVELFNWQLDIESKRGVNVWIWTGRIWVGLNICDGLSFLRRKQGLYPELDEGFLDWHETKRLELP